jgi:hypothetical protein
MRAVAAQMKAAGYRSYPNYVSAIKDVHLKASNEWSDALQRCHERCVASTQRGIGPPKQCLELSPIAVARLQLGPEPLVEDGPICPAQWAVICAFHILRGAESACALAAALTIDSVGQRETLFLPVSKTDPQATGCHRSWGCICADKLDEHAACPYHAAVQLKTELTKRFGNKRRELPKGLPLFPNAQGDWCTRKGFIGTLTVLADMVQVPTTDAQGRNVIGEHIWRVSGSRHLAELGVPQPMIMLLARWGSSIILRYIDDAPLRKLTQTYVALACSSTATPPVEDITRCEVDDAALPYEPEEAVKLAATMIEAIEDDTDIPAEQGRFAYNADTNYVHVRARRPSWERSSVIPGRANCGWDYRAWNGSILDTVPSHALRCGKCARPGTWTTLTEDTQPTSDTD